VSRGTSGVADGAPDVPGETMLDKMLWLQRHGGDLRRCLLYEPRGYPNLFADLILPSTPPAPGDHVQGSADLGREALQHLQEREIDPEHRVADHGAGEPARPRDGRSQTRVTAGSGLEFTHPRPSPVAVGQPPPKADAVFQDLTPKLRYRC